MVFQSGSRLASSRTAWKVEERDWVSCGGEFDWRNWRNLRAVEEEDKRRVIWKRVRGEREGDKKEEFHLFSGVWRRCCTASVIVESSLVCGCGGGGGSLGEVERWQTKRRKRSFDCFDDERVMLILFRV